ncbi:MAG: hypothetical protein ACFE7E_06930 [Candidatus Hodarchaeota archaeon]
MSQKKREKKESIKGVFNGRVPDEIPLNIELGDPEIEAQYGDTVNVSCRISRFRRFYQDGGPFKRTERSLREWVKEFDIHKYDWPESKEIVKTLIEQIADTVKRFGNRFIICKILGPTETAEAFCASGQDNRARHLGQVQHNFNFSMLSFLNLELAAILHKRISTYIIECIRGIGSLKEVDAIRIADDAADYHRLLYPRNFMEKVYLPNHEILASLIHKVRKHSIIHCDGNIFNLNIAERLSDYYAGFHPLDLVSRITRKDTQNWVRSLKEARDILPESVFFTGIPIELLYDPAVSVEEFGDVCRKVILALGKRYLVLSTTHRPFPGFSIETQGAKKKLRSIRKLF